MSAAADDLVNSESQGSHEVEADSGWWWCRHNASAVSASTPRLRDAALLRDSLQQRGHAGP